MRLIKAFYIRLVLNMPQRCSTAVYFQLLSYLGAYSQPTHLLRHERVNVTVFAGLSIKLKPKAVGLLLSSHHHAVLMAACSPDHHRSTKAGRRQLPQRLV